MNSLRIASKRLAATSRKSVLTNQNALNPVSSRRLASTFYNASIAGLTEDQAEFQSAVSNFAQTEIAPRAEEVDKSNNFPMDLWEKFGQMGLLGVSCCFSRLLCVLSTEHMLL